MKTAGVWDVKIPAFSPWIWYLTSLSLIFVLCGRKDVRLPTFLWALKAFENSNFTLILLGSIWCLLRGQRWSSPTSALDLYFPNYWTAYTYRENCALAFSLDFIGLGLCCTCWRGFCFVSAGFLCYHPFVSHPQYPGTSQLPSVTLHPCKLEN